MVIIREKAGKVLCTTPEQLTRIPVKDEYIRFMQTDGTFKVVTVIHTVNHGVEVIVEKISDD
jgi:hypothetical protein